MQKRGLSTIVTTLIMILFVLAAVAIVWVVIKNVIVEKSEEISIRSFTMNLEIKNVKIEEDTISMDVKRNPGKGEITGIKFIFDDGTNTEIINEEIVLKELDTEGFSFTLDNLNIHNVETISIVPINIDDSGKEVIGPLMDSWEPDYWFSK